MRSCSWPVDGARFSMGFSSFPCKGVESFCPDNLWLKPFFAPGPLLGQLYVSRVSKPITSDFSESHLTARMVTKKPHLTQRQFLSGTGGAVISSSLDDPISITYSSHSSFPAWNHKHGSADKETGLHTPFLSLLICLSLVDSLPNNGIVKWGEKLSLGWEYGDPLWWAFWGLSIQGMEVGSIYRQNKTFAKK